LDLQPLHHALPPAAPPLRQQLRLREAPPEALARGVEDALDADLAVAGGGDYQVAAAALAFGSLHRGCAHDTSPFRSRNSARLSNCSSPICRCFWIQALSSSSRRALSRQVRTRPTFSVTTSPASSSTWTCFFRPVSVISKLSARSLIDAPPRPSRSR